MKKLLLIISINLIILINFLTFNPSLIFAQNDDHTAREEAEGEIIWEDLQAKKISCADLTDEQFQAVGEYFMGQTMGASHEAMNNMMIQMMGEEGEKQMHVAMGKRMSGCEPNAPMPQNMMDSGMMPMMTGFGNQMKGGDNNMMWGFQNNPMGWFGFGFGWILMILFWVLIIWGIIAFFRWFSESGKTTERDNKALTILKERYAKGEIDKKEFEEKRKDLI